MPRPPGPFLLLFRKETCNGCRGFPCPGHLFHIGPRKEDAHVLLASATMELVVLRK
jgi:hypothetical protein